jgi:hypothetical protein
MTDWAELFEQLQIVGRPRKPKVATPDSIAEFETSNDFKLPASYVEFATVFGAGELGGFFRFCVPLSRNGNWDLATFHLEVYSHRHIWADSVSSREVVDDLVFFGSSVGGSMIAWRRDEVTNKKKHECKVYYLEQEAAAQLVADSFGEFFSVCLQGRVGGFTGPVPQEFVRP